MGIGGISPWSLVLILLIVLLLFGTKRLRNIGGDLGNAIKNFKKSVSEEDNKAEEEKVSKQKDKGRIIDAEVEEKDKSKDKEKTKDK
jgi:sec-independent protein translocase protein TatA